MGFFAMNKKEFNIKNITSAITIFAIIFTVAVLGQTMMIVNNATGGTQNFAEGVTISQVNVGGLDQDRAAYAVGSLIKQKIDEMNLSVTYGDKVWQFTGTDFEVEENVNKVVADAYKYQQQIINKTQSTEFDSIIARGMNIDVAFPFLFKDINAKMDDIINQVDRQPVNSRVTFDASKQNKFTYSESKSGVKVDRIKLLKDLEKEFKVNHTNMQVNLSTVTIEPEFTEAYLKDRTQLVSIFSTDLHNSKQRRLHNVGLALSKFDGMTIKSGEEVSFNAVTSPQTVEGGYEKSIIIFNGQFVEGVGGGLCQASTTLYNAVILADLEVIEVSKHTLPVGYIELALDAMVSENWSDMRFKNNSQDNIYIAAYLKEERAYVEIYGKTLDNGIKIKRRSEFIKTIGHKGDEVIFDVKGEYASKVLYKGERFRLSYPREGYEAKAYLQYYSGGNLIKEVQIRHEIYEPQQGIVVEGNDIPPKDYVIESQVELIPPQKKTSDTTGNNVSAVIQKINPVTYNP